MARDPRIDAYIAKSADFARPILEHVRELVHKTVPDAGEAIKWGMPRFTHNDKSIAGMAAFKGHCAVMVHGDGRQSEGMGSYGKITSLDELPDDAVMSAKFIEARERIDTKGTAAKRSSRLAPKPELAMPQDFAAALRDNPKAQATFEGFPPSQRREYVAWVSDAKQDATRAKRLATSIEWLAEGKHRNWKYER
ncbi:MAG TPA: YdeI/OmpD-associated family protein [Croceibacterium sp.]|nr:YdeI/OmpD-associated family protein [Croceibacterium sp.]